MSMFKKHICSECSCQMLLIAKRFTQEKILCKKCAGILSNVGLQETNSYEDYLAIKEYQKDNYETMRRVFHETYAYKNIHVDADNLLFYIGDKINQDTIFLRFSRISSCRFDFSVPRGARSFFGAVACTISVFIKMWQPNISYQYMIYDQAPTTYEDSEHHIDLWGDDYYVEKYSYDRPDSLKVFLEYFHGACRRTGVEFNKYGHKINCFEEDEKLFEAMRRGISLDEDILLDILEEPDEEIENPKCGVAPCETEKCAECPDNCETKKTEFCEPPIPFVSNREYISEQEYQEIMDFVQSEVACEKDGQE